MASVIYHQQKNVMLIKKIINTPSIQNENPEKLDGNEYKKTFKTKLYTIGVDNNFSRESGKHEHEKIDVNIAVRQTISNGIKRIC